MEEAIAILITTAVNATVKEILFWSKGRTEEEIKARTEAERKRTSDLMDKVNNP